MKSPISTVAILWFVTAFFPARAAQSQLNGISIGVDPGHGGTATGAVGPTGVLEKDVNLETSLALQRYLQSDLATVWMTRTTDVTISLDYRTSYLLSQGAERIISVHHNAAGDNVTNRTMDFVYCGYCSSTASDLATLVINRLAASTGLTKGPAASTADTLCASQTFSCSIAGVGQADLHMVRVPQTAGVPATLVEVSYISSTTEEARLKTADYIDSNGWAIYAGVADHFGVAPRSRTSDSTAPTVNISSPCNSSCTVTVSPIAVTGTATDSGGSGLNHVFVNNTTANSYGSDYSVSGNSAGYSVSGIALVPGQNWILVQAQDNAGNWSQVTSISVTYQPPTNCTYAVAPTTAVGNGSGGSSYVQVTGTPSGCSGSWSSSNDASWLILSGPTSGNGSGTSTINYSYPANPSTTSMRQATLSFTGNFPYGNTFTVTQNASTPSVCSYTISPQSANPSSASGSISVQITASPNGCGGSWTATANDSWIHVAPATGSGFQQVIVSWDTNDVSSSRTGTATLAGNTFTVSQSGTTQSVFWDDVTPAAATGLSETVAVDAADRVFLAAGNAGMLRSVDRGNSWSGVNSGLTVSNVTALASSSSAMFAATHGGGIFRSTDAQTWTAVGPSGSHITCLLTAGSALYGGDGFYCSGAYRSYDAGASWTTINSGLSTCVNAFARFASGRIVAGTGTAGIFASDNDGASWSAAGSGVVASNVHAAASDGGNRVYIATNKGGIYRSVDGGNSWAAANNGLPKLDLYSIAVARNGTVFAGGELGGLFRSDDGGDTWYDASSSLATGSTVVAIAADSAGFVYFVWNGHLYRSHASIGSGTQRIRSDFNADGKSDVILQNTSGDVAEWQMNGIIIVSGAAFYGPGSTWKVVASGDFDGDGKSDLLLQNSASGDVAVWLMNGFTITAGAIISTPGLVWRPIATADFDGDGKSDIVLQNQNNGDVAIWMMNGASVAAGAVVGFPGTSWAVMQAADFNGDGKGDIILRNLAGDLAEWQMNGFAIMAGAVFSNPGSTWNVVSSGDYDNDGRADLLLQNAVSGEVAVWIMNGFTITSGAVVASPGTAWKPMASGDYDGNGKFDVVLRNQSTGDIAIWEMNGGSVAAGAVVSSPGLSWTPLAH